MVKVTQKEHRAEITAYTVEKKAKKQQKPLNVMSEMDKRDEIAKEAIVYLESMMTGNFTMADAIK